MMDAVILRDVSYDIANSHILHRLSLTIQSGSITGILGPNGAGKTTLLSILNGLRVQTSGSVNVLGASYPTNDGSIKRKIGVVLQETALYDELSINENLQFAASLYAVQDTERRISHILKLLNLDDRAEQIVSTLSGGLRRRVAIARALIHDPEFLIIDEPTLGVDVEARHAIWSHLRLLRSKGSTVVVATNYLDEAQALCDTVAVLKEGNLIQVASPQQLIEQTGSCLDVECDPQVSKELIHSLKESPGILRIDDTPSGFSVFLKQKSYEKSILEKIMRQSTIAGFRFRSPDLAEVFKSLEHRI